MKTITLEFEEQENPSDNIFMGIDELVKQKDSELNITHRINKETSKQFLEILEQIIEDLEYKFAEANIDFKFDKIKTFERSNLFEEPKVFGIIDGSKRGFAICINPTMETREDSRFTTYYGGYEIQYSNTNADDFISNDGNFYRVKDVSFLEEKLFTYIKSELVG